MNNSGHVLRSRNTSGHVLRSRPESIALGYASGFSCCSRVRACRVGVDRPRATTFGEFWVHSNHNSPDVGAEGGATPSRVTR
jgi:hypothetical protein